MLRAYLIFVKKKWNSSGSEVTDLSLDRGRMFSYNSSCEILTKIQRELSEFKDRTKGNINAVDLFARE